MDSGIHFTVIVFQFIAISFYFRALRVCVCNSVFLMEYWRNSTAGVWCFANYLENGRFFGNTSFTTFFNFEMSFEAYNALLEGK